MLLLLASYTCITLPSRCAASHEPFQYVATGKLYRQGQIVADVPLTFLLEPLIGIQILPSLSGRQKYLKVWHAGTSMSRVEVEMSCLTPGIAAPVLMPPFK